MQDHYSIAINALDSLEAQRVETKGYLEAACLKLDALQRTALAIATPSTLDHPGPTPEDLVRECLKISFEGVTLARIQQLRKD